MSEARGQFENKGRETSAVGTRYQKTGDDCDSNQCVTVIHIKILSQGTCIKKRTKLRSLSQLVKYTERARQPRVGKVSNNYCG
jgi:hypothetical protein